MISNFSVSADRRTVSWTAEALEVTFDFEYPASAYHVEYLDVVLLLADARERGSNNLYLYNADGSVKARPDMPQLQHEVQGVYAVWFNQGDRQQTIILLTNEFSPYDTACQFDLETYKFTKFHPSK